MKTFSTLDKNEITINMDLMLNTICQYKCPYCYARALYKWGQMMNKKNLDLLLDQMAKCKVQIAIDILGGEPTLYPHLTYAIERIISIDAVKKCSIFTNGAREPPSITSPKFEINVTWHPTECHDDDKFMDYVERHHDRISQVTVMVPRKYIDRARQIMSRLLSRYTDIAIEPTPLVVNNKILKIDDTLGGDNHYKFCGKLYTYNGLVNAGLNRFRGWQCMMTQFIISLDGSVASPCVPYRSNAITKNFFESLGDMWVTCDMDECIHDCTLESPKYLLEPGETAHLANNWHTIPVH